MSKNELTWKHNSYNMKNIKQCFDSAFMLSTALCIELAPSPPLRASPGPSIPHFNTFKRIRQSSETYKCGNRNAQQSKSHTTGCSGKISKLNQTWNVTVNLHAETTVAKTSQKSTLRSHSLESSGPIVQLLFSDVQSFDLQVSQGGVLDCVDHFLYCIWRRILQACSRWQSKACPSPGLGWIVCCPEPESAGREMIGPGLAPCRVSGEWLPSPEPVGGEAHPPSGLLVIGL